MSTLTDKQIAKIVDEMAELEKVYKPVEKRFTELKKQLADYANSQTENSSIYLTSDDYYIEYSKPSNSLVCKVCPEKFLEVTECYDAISVVVSVAKEQLDDDVLEELFETKVGSRRLLKIVPIASYQNITNHNPHRGLWFNRFHY